MSKAPSNPKLLIEAAAKILRLDFDGMTFERMLCRPTDAMRFCRKMREELVVKIGNDEAILWALLNARKQGYLRKVDIESAK